MFCLELPSRDMSPICPHGKGGTGLHVTSRKTSSNTDPDPILGTTCNTRCRTDLTRSQTLHKFTIFLQNCSSQNIFLSGIYKTPWLILIIVSLTYFSENISDGNYLRLNCHMMVGTHDKQFLRMRQSSMHTTCRSMFY